MALLNQHVQVTGQIDKLFAALRAGQAPEKFTREFLRDLGFKSSNHLAFIPLLKGLGFLTNDGSPTQRYRDFLDSTRSRRVLGEAVREAYSDIFTIKARPSKADKSAISGKFKSTFNLSETSADRCANTFLALLDLADHEPVSPPSITVPPQNENTNASPIEVEKTKRAAPPLGLHYNIQIHLPATKDVEVYNAIFKSIRDHLID